MLADVACAGVEQDPRDATGSGLWAEGDTPGFLLSRSGSKFLSLDGFDICHNGEVNASSGGVSEILPSCTSAACMSARPHESHLEVTLTMSHTNQHDVDTPFACADKHA